MKHRAGVGLVLTVFIASVFAGCGGGSGAGNSGTTPTPANITVLATRVNLYGVTVTFSDNILGPADNLVRVYDNTSGTIIPVNGTVTVVGDNIIFTPDNTYQLGGDNVFWFMNGTNTARYLVQVNSSITGHGGGVLPMAYEYPFFFDQVDLSSSNFFLGGSSSAGMQFVIWNHALANVDPRTICTGNVQIYAGTSPSTTTPVTTGSLEVYSAITSPSTWHDPADSSITVVLWTSNAMTPGNYFVRVRGASKTGALDLDGNPLTANVDIPFSI